MGELCERNPKARSGTGLLSAWGYDLSPYRHVRRRCPEIGHVLGSGMFVLLRVSALALLLQATQVASAQNAPAPATEAQAAPVAAVDAAVPQPEAASAA